jgi:hypothetical protein
MLINVFFRAKTLQTLVGFMTSTVKKEEYQRYMTIEVLHDHVMAAILVPKVVRLVNSCLICFYLSTLVEISRMKYNSNSKTAIKIFNDPEQLQLLGFCMMTSGADPGGCTKK